VGNRLDLDVATAAQIDSLPGVTPLMARRIVADRMTRGPFLSADGLRRVSGVGSGFLKRIDTLITFSGTFIQSSASDTVIPKRRKARRGG
jgi:competence protein ComEA